MLLARSPISSPAAAAAYLPRLCACSFSGRKVGRTHAMARQITCTYENWKDGIDRLLQLPAPHYVVCVADADPATGRSWCPDCVRAVPGVQQAVGDAGASLLELQVGPRTVWKSPDHPLRQDSTWKLTGVPTLLHWAAAGPGQRLAADLENADSSQAAAELVAQFIAKTR